MSRKETDKKTKLIQEKCNTVSEMGGNGKKMAFHGRIKNQQSRKRMNLFHSFIALRSSWRKLGRTLIEKLAFRYAKVSMNEIDKKTEHWFTLFSSFQILAQLLRDEDNKYCCDCDSKGPRWASWNLGIFLCIRCAGIHRNLGESTVFFALDDLINFHLSHYR